MIAVLIHWRVKPDEKSISEFLKHWKTQNTIDDKKGLMGEFLSDSLPIDQYPFITWHLDPESLGNFKSYVTIGLWQKPEDFKEQVADYFNDDKPLLPFEKYRRRRVIFEPVAWRIGSSQLPDADSEGVQ